jgi:hypothetical protein
MATNRGGHPLRQEVVSEILGHSTAAFTMDVYAAVAEELAEAAALAIAAFVPRRASNVPAEPDDENGVWDCRASPARSGVLPDGGGGRESNPPTAQRAVHRF